ncbi:hypothetical protein SKAU_G00112380 [Synaphobranchus kaupii]|uniref:Gypsy retrotransposon integrase-like protein 1 n=1 Tax=Synaphobranchus kaupii TaxID=118154 RepID=A0A9Q1G0N0_SYNKA|nr:hypothetical protein SKAU_G00112380 [Synaphobranchus kaupii]
MAATIPPPAPMKLSGNLSANWEIFRAEYEDYALATGLVDKPEGVQAATLRRVMGAECRHVDKHNLHLSSEGQVDVTVILNPLERYFKPAKNVIYERYVFGCCKQEEGSTSEEMGLMHFTIPEELRVEGLNTVDDSLTMPLTRNTVVRAYHDVFTSPVEAVTGEVHFELDPAVHCTTQFPEVYQRKQHELLEGLEGVEPIADDILVVGCGDSEDEACKDHDAKLVALLHRWRQVKLWLSVKKLQFRVSEVRFHGHILSAAVTVQSDSSQHGMGCCLMQEGQPIAFASRALTLTEQNYAQIEKECLSIVFACQRFHHYLYERDNITAEADHKPLIAIFSKPLLNAPKRLQSMLLALQNYNLRVIYKPGPEMFVSDTLGKAVTSNTHPGSMHAEHTVCSMVDEQLAIEHINMADYLNIRDKRLLQIQHHTDNDRQLQAMKNTILKGWPGNKDETEQAVRLYWPIKEELSVQNGVLFRGQRVVIPKSLRPEMLARVHCSHIGGEACYRQARETIYWPGMQSEIKDFVSKCTTCNEYAIEQQKETLLSHELPTRPWQIVSLDLFQHSGKDFLLLVDHYSDFWEIDVLPDLSAETTIKRCKAQFARYGQPDRVISDNGPQFACTQFRKFAVEWEFEHITSSPRHPKANGKAEAAVKITKNLCKKALREGKDAWKAILQWRNTRTESIDSSPAQRLMSRRLKSALPVAPALLEPQVIADVVDRLRHRKQVSKLIYDRTARDLPELAVGEAVWMKPLPGDRTGIWRRGVCLQKVAPRSYLVEVEGAFYRRNRVDLRMAEPMPSQNPMVGSEGLLSGGSGVQAQSEMTEGERACMFSPPSTPSRIYSSLHAPDPPPWTHLLSHVHPILLLSLVMAVRYGLPTDLTF